MLLWSSCPSKVLLDKYELWYKVVWLCKLQGSLLNYFSYLFIIQIFGDDIFFYLVIMKKIGDEIFLYLFIMQKIGDCDFFQWAYNEMSPYEKRVTNRLKEKCNDIARLEKLVQTEQAKYHANFEKLLETEQAKYHADLEANLENQSVQFRLQLLSYQNRARMYKAIITFIIFILVFFILLMMFYGSRSSCRNLMLR
jgi:hypothetical protein